MRAAKTSIRIQVGEVMSKSEVRSDRGSNASVRLETNVPDAPVGPPDPRGHPPISKTPPATPDADGRAPPKPVDDPPAEAEPKPPVHRIAAATPMMLKVCVLT